LAILEAVKQWETARMAGAFPAEVKAVLRDNAREFHLQPLSERRWNLYAAHTERFTHDAAQVEATRWTFQNPHAAQLLQWVVRCAGQQPVTGVTVVVNGKPVLGLKQCVLPPGGSLKYTGGTEACVCDSAWKELSRVPVASAAAQVGSGEQQMAVGCNSQSGSSLKVELRTLGSAKALDGGPGNK
jgi:hypothetical protein